MEQTLACAPAIRIFDRLLRGFDAPPALRLWNDALHIPTGSTAVFTLVLRDPCLLRRLVIQRNPALLADAYFRGALDVEGDLYAALQLKGQFAAISLSWRDKLALLRDALRLPGPDQTGFKPVGNLASRLARRFSHRHSRDSDRLLGLTWLWPGYIEAVWNLDVLFPWRPWGLPMEELLFGFGFGMYWSGVYEHLTWHQMVTSGVRRASSRLLFKDQ